jgi:hypothetical protein
MPGLRTRARSRTAVRLAAHCQAVGHVRRSEGAGVTMDVSAFARCGVELRQGEAVEQKLCMKGAAAEYAQVVWPRVMHAVCTAVQDVPTSARSAADQRAAPQAVTGIACGRQRKVRPNPSLKRSANGRPPGPRGAMAYPAPRGPGVLPGDVPEAVEPMS